MSRKCEILAPVGNEEMLAAAIQAEADAVYIGGSQFSARAYAHNFTDDKMSQAISLCHFYNKKVYVTVNTIIKEREMEEALNYIRFLYNNDVDAVILQDLGLARAVNKQMPDLEIHASTQLNTRNVYGASFLKEIGFSRIVLAREIPLEEIKRIKDQIDIELEMFIHGSLCVCESGSCYMSSFIGGRSGNRGRCAQPCRKEYQLYTKEKKRVGEENSYLSLKDLNTINHINKIQELGIDSLKIEGRMKKPEYVYSAVMNYKAKLEGFEYSFDLEEFRNRDFTEGFQWSLDNAKLKEIDRKDLHKGKRIGKIVKKKKIQIKLEEDLNKGDILLFETKRGKHLQLEVKNQLKRNETLDISHIKDAKINSLVNRISNESFLEVFSNQSFKKRGISLFFKGRKNSRAELKVNLGEISVEIFGEDPIQEAENAPITKEKIIKQLAKTGNTLFVPESIKIDIEEDLFISMGELNALRREALDLLYKKASKKHSRDFIEDFSFGVSSKRGNPEKALLLETENFSIGEGKVENYYFSGASKKYKNKEYIFRVPRIDYKNERFVKKQIIDELDKIEGFLVSSINELFFIENFGKHVYADWTFNIANSQYLKLLQEYGCIQAALSLELNFDEINEIEDIPGIRKELIVYSPLLVMSTRFCPFSSLKKCDILADCVNCSFKEAYMTDSKNQWLKVSRNYGFTRIYNEEPMETANFFDEILSARADALRLDISNDENPEKVFNHYYSLFENKSSGTNYNKMFSKAHYKRGVE